MSTVDNNTAASVLGQYQNASTAKSSSDELGKGEFMELMLAQLNNQNPLEPQDNGDFIAQLAQFSSLEEIQGLAGSVDDVVGQFRSTQALQASAMVGRTVLVPSQTGILSSAGEMKGVVGVPASTSSLRVSIMNPSGELVRQIDLGPAQAGQTSFEWDGTDGSGEALEPGAYVIKAEGSYPSGTEQLGTLVSANVDSVSLGNAGSVTLNLAGMGSIALSDVSQIN